MAAWINFLTGSLAGTVVELPEEDVTIGRNPDRFLTFSPNEVLVSTEHATMLFRQEKYVLRDDGSRNGTFVNGERITEEHELEHGDLLQFGPGGPGGRFQTGSATEPLPTLDPTELARPLHAVGARASPRVDRANRSTREMLAVALGRSRRTRRALILVSAIAVVGITVLIIMQLRSRANLESALAELSTFLDSERASRSAMQMDLASIQVQADSLRAVVEEEQRRVANNPGIDPAAIRRMSRGVALLVFTYGYTEEGGNRLLRYDVGPQGEVVFESGPAGRPVASLTFGGSGQPVQHQGTATGFLVDSTGILLTNRHVAEPWAQAGEIAFLRSRGLDVAGTFIDLRAYFPPGDQSRPLVVEGISNSADVAVMSIDGPPPQSPALHLARGSDAAGPGDQLILIAYPTGLHNLLFRETRAERERILEMAGDDAVRLAEELARRRLIQPLITNGGISDATNTEVIHTAATTVGASGGPLINFRRGVVAIHYASVRSPAPGDPFQTQRGVPIRYAWEILPATVLRNSEPER